MYAPPPLARFDLASYFVRIELEPPEPPAPPGPPPPTLATLATLQWAHLRAIPFENFSLRLPAAAGLPPRADPAAAFEKLVRARRGGWCFEHAAVLGAALTALGFAVWSGTARVVERAPAAAPPPGRLALSPLGAHHVLFVDVGGDIFLVDGGAAGLEAPLPMRVPAPGAAADASGADAYAGAAWVAALPGAPAERAARYRLRPALLGCCAGGGAAPAAAAAAAAAAAPGAAHAGGFCLQHRQAGAAAGSGEADSWKDVYYFTLAPALPTDFVAMNELSLTRPRFAEHTIATRWTLGGLVALLDGSLRRHGADGALVGEEALEGEAALLAAVRGEFGVAL
jgi:arylamine N-acetyltransferase